MKTLCVSLTLSLVALGTGPGRAPTQIPGDVVPLHSFADVPALPRDVPALVSRFGDVDTPDEREKGDLATEPLRQRINGWMHPTSLPAAGYSAMAGGAGMMSPAAGQAINDLAQTAQRMTAEFSELVQTFTLKTVPPLKQPYEATRDRIYKEYNPKIERCLTLSERAHGSSCADPTPARDAAVNAAGTEFLQSVAGPFTDYVGRLKQVAAEGEAAIDRAAKAFGKSTPAIARGQIMIIRQNELNALLAALSAEQDLFLYVYARSELPKNQPHSP